VNYGGWLNKELPCAASLLCNSKHCLEILKTRIDVMPRRNISFRSDLSKVVFVLVVIKSSSVMNLKLDQKKILVPIKDPIESSVLNSFFLVLLTTL
jgi:hypothetical protein